MGAELAQYYKEEWHPISFFSKKFTKAQKNYSTYERELQAVFYAVKCFKHHLEGRTFHIYTDQKRITSIMIAKAEKSQRVSILVNAQQLSWLASALYGKGCKKTLKSGAKRVKNANHRRSQDTPTHPWETAKQPDKRLAEIHVDLVGPLTQSQFMKYVFTIVDRFTRWPEAIPIPDAMAETCAKALLHNWISRYGLPGVINADRGSQFTSKFWSGMKKLLGIKTIQRPITPKRMEW